VVERFESSRQDDGQNLQAPTATTKGSQTPEMTRKGPRLHQQHTERAEAEGERLAPGLSKREPGETTWTDSGTGLN